MSKLVARLGVPALTVLVLAGCGSSKNEPIGPEWVGCSRGSAVLPEVARWLVQNWSGRSPGTARAWREGASCHRFRRRFAD